MKKLLIAIALLSSTCTLSAQTFRSLSLDRSDGIDKVIFTVSEETNICYYLLEGSRDSVVFEIVIRTSAAGNTRLPRSYAITSYDTAYRFYRIRQVDMSAGSLYSARMMANNNQQPLIQAIEIKEAAIVKRQE